MSTSILLCKVYFLRSDIGVFKTGARLRQESRLTRHPFGTCRLPPSSLPSVNIFSYFAQILWLNFHPISITVLETGSVFNVQCSRLRSSFHRRRDSPRTPGTGPLLSTSEYSLVRSPATLDTAESMEDHRARSAFIAMLA